MREKKIERKADRKRAMSVRKRRIKGWERERGEEITGFERDRKIGAGERERQGYDRERESERERANERENQRKREAWWERER